MDNATILNQYGFAGYNDAAAITNLKSLQTYFKETLGLTFTLNTWGALMIPVVSSDRCRYNEINRWGEVTFMRSMFSYRGKWYHDDHMALISDILYDCKLLGGDDIYILRLQDNKTKDDFTNEVFGGEDFVEMYPQLFAGGFVLCQRISNGCGGWDYHSLDNDCLLAGGTPSISCCFFGYDEVESCMTASKFEV